ncbi:MAG TPA: CoA pyrophosphatase [Thermoanaerobaculia bacterium]
MSAPPPGATGWIEDLARRLAQRPRAAAVVPESRRRAGVLAPLFVRDRKLWVLLTQRTDTVEHHPGQISFPGGVEEPEDGTLWATALRESEEELGIRGADVRPIGRLSPMVTSTNFYVEPFVGAIPQPYVYRPHSHEIAEVLEVPLIELLAPGVREDRPWPGRDVPVVFYRWRGKEIWGATGRMLAELLEAVG